MDSCSVRFVYPASTCNIFVLVSLNDGMSIHVFCWLAGYSRRGAAVAQAL